MNQSVLEKHLAQKMGVVATIGSLIWIALLMHGANIVHNNVLGTHYVVRLGPVALNEITKVPVGDSFVVSLAFRPGIALFFVFWVAVGVFWAFGSARHQDNKQPNKKLG